MKRLLCVALVLTAAVGTGCNKLKSPTEVGLDDMIKVARVESTPLRADSVSTTTIRATVPADATTRDVKFTTSLGWFEGTAKAKETTLAADQQGQATAILHIEATSGTAFVSAKILSFQATTQIDVLPAFPDSMLIDPAGLKVTRDGTVKPTITVFLRRTSGSVSDNILITFTATQAINGVTKNVGRFSGLDGNRSALGKATTIFAADTGDVDIGLVTVRATSVDDQGRPVTGDVGLRAE